MGMLLGLPVTEITPEIVEVQILLILLHYYYPTVKTGTWNKIIMTWNMGLIITYMNWASGSGFDEELKIFKDSQSVWFFSLNIYLGLD